MDAIRQTFFQECEEQLVELEAGLLRLDGGARGAEIVDAVFRAVHSIKGGAGAFGLDELVHFAHAYETALDALRSNRIAPEPDAMAVLLRAADLLADLVRAAREGGRPDPSRAQVLERDLAALAGAPAASELDWRALLDFQPVPAATAAVETWRISFRPHASLYQTGNDAIVLLRELARLGDADVTLDTSALPPLDALEPEAAYLAWTVALTTASPEQDIRAIFEFVEGECDLEIATLTQAAIALPPPLPKPSPEPVHRAEPAATHPTIRVDLDRLDRLIDLVGELVINQSVLVQRLAETGGSRSSGIAVGLEELEGLTREIQDSVMAIRAQPVKAVFQRLPRLAREVAALTGKQVRLMTDGEGTEVDNSIIERLADPLTHMIRNAIDHGIEMPQQRIAAGKPAEGTIRVGAGHRSGRIVIEVSDDGAGIDRERVRSSAIAKGLVAADAALSEDEVDNLIFAAGFSTATSVSDISGRGVGMDVVRRSIQALGGRIGIASQPGRGSTFSLSLPLTLAVLDGMVVGVQDGRFVVPLNTIVETFQPSAIRTHRLGDGACVVSIRGSFVPLIDIGVALGLRDRRVDPASAVALLVEAEDGRRAALVVDDIHGQRQVVIKSLETNYRAVPGLAGATILGDGRVALILDVSAIVLDPAFATDRREPLTAPRATGLRLQDGHRVMDGLV